MTTPHLDDAALYLTLGGKLIRLDGKYPDNQFTIELKGWRKWYADKIGWVPYLRFCNARRYLKRKGRKAAGLPARFTGDSRSHFTLTDLAIVK